MCMYECVSVCECVKDSNYRDSNGYPRPALGNTITRRNISQFCTLSNRPVYIKDSQPSESNCILPSWSTFWKFVKASLETLFTASDTTETQTDHCQFYSMTFYNSCLGNLWCNLALNIISSNFSFIFLQTIHSSPLSLSSDGVLASSLSAD